MVTVSHALFYAVLLGAGIISTAFSAPKTESSFSQNVLQTVATDKEMEPSKPLEEIKTPVNRLSYPIDSTQVTVYMSNTGTVKKLELEDYVAGVLLAEMPSWYDEEALKAAAVAARTYTLYKMNSSTHSQGADVCTASSHCQAYYDIGDAVAAWSEESAVSAYEKVRNAVKMTEGEILVYDNQPILAMYHASSYLKTRSSAEVFGGERAYLQSVDVGFESGEDTRFSKKEFSHKAAEDILSACGVSGKLVGLESVWESSKCLGLRVLSEKESVFVEAGRVRSLFSLASANFEVEKTSDGFVFSVYGYGHGVGLSQQGANILAERGYEYHEILSKYYVSAQLAILKKYE